MENQEIVLEESAMPEEGAETIAISQQKEPLFCRFMDSALNVVIRDEIKAPLQPRTFSKVDTVMCDKPATGGSEESAKL